MKVLIVSTRYLGDCLIAAGLAAPIKTYLPEAEVHMLTFESNRSILEGVQGIDNVIGVKQHPIRSSKLRHTNRRQQHKHQDLSSCIPTACGRGNSKRPNHCHSG